MEQKELFKPFPLNADWQAGNLGTILRPNGKPAKQSNHSLGYLSLGIPIEGGFKTFKAHRVIALTWVPNPDNKATVNHINGIKDDNRAVNLEWLTLSENHLHAWQTGLQANRRGEKRKPHSEETKELMRAAKLGRTREYRGKWN